MGVCACVCVYATGGNTCQFATRSFSFTFVVVPVAAE